MNAELLGPAVKENLLENEASTEKHSGLGHSLSAISEIGAMLRLFNTWVNFLGG